MGTIDDNKIIDALNRCISNGAYCADCPIREECDPSGIAINNYSIGLIRKLRRENGQLKRKVTVTAKKHLTTCSIGSTATRYEIRNKQSNNICEKKGTQ